MVSEKKIYPNESGKRRRIDAKAARCKPDRGGIKTNITGLKLILTMVGKGTRM